ncbi:MAG: hypothetical protein J3K34DRAFT_461450 [Monoraphidium minutum]|nr:MAG: hypothetical protein J3K34DRAFT_461450 [Monoraphidium minutum]
MVFIPRNIFLRIPPVCSRYKDAKKIPVGIIYRGHTVVLYHWYNTGEAGSARRRRMRTNWNGQSHATSFRDRSLEGRARCVLDGSYCSLKNAVLIILKRRLLRSCKARGRLRSIAIDWEPIAAGVVRVRRGATVYTHLNKKYEWGRRAVDKTADGDAMARTGTVWGAVWRAAAAPLSRRARAPPPGVKYNRYPLVYPRYIYHSVIDTKEAGIKYRWYI